MSDDKTEDTGVVDLIAPQGDALQSNVASKMVLDAGGVGKQQTAEEIQKEQDAQAYMLLNNNNEQQHAFFAALVRDKIRKDRDEIMQEYLTAEGFRTHEENKEGFKKYYQINAEDESTIKFTPELMVRMYTDIWDDVMVLNAIAREDKKSTWRDKVEFGLGFIFGLLIIAGSLLIAADTAMAGDVDCDWDAKKCTTQASPLMQAGSWTVFVGGFAFLAIILWRIFTRLRSKAHVPFRKRLSDLVLDSSYTDQLALNHGIANAIKKKAPHKKKQQKAPITSDPAMAPEQSRFYRGVPSYYAPRSAYHRVATRYGSPNMC